MVVGELAVFQGIISGCFKIKIREEIILVVVLLIHYKGENGGAAFIT